jgi:predicted SnoaL-like aldol condensation-catalyzing enzyme
MDPSLGANKEVVEKFYDFVINKKDFASAKQYLGKHYTQHNPLAADGPEGLKTFIEFLKTNFPDARSEIKRAFADGDYVILHVHSIRPPNMRGRAIVEIFRMADGKIDEHWDVIQEIPETSANHNGIF